MIWLSALLAVNAEIIQRIARDYFVLFRISDGSDPRFFVWSYVVALCSKEGLPQSFQHNIRYTSRLPLAVDSSGNMRIQDDYLSWYVHDHLDIVQDCYTVPQYEMPPAFGQIFERYPSLYQQLNLSRDTHSKLLQFEVVYFGVFVNNPADYTSLRQTCKVAYRQYEFFLADDARVARSSVDQLAMWMVTLLCTGWGALSVNPSLDGFLQWINNDSRYFPMWALFSGFRHFCAHAIEEPVASKRNKQTLTRLAQRLWGSDCFRILYDSILRVEGFEYQCQQGLWN